ncbi:MAG: 2Fe-2S iron-sulfur cluster-binding protein, partial [Planctomycetota bacterium]|nr:2Fe-2S iron-sulfur cluster-binding protein [Planctomycetota bacterium]
MAKTWKVLFTPDGASVEVPGGSTILAAANAAGVYVNSLCGGDGVCGRCRVIVKKGKTSGGSTEFFTREEIQQGYILACQGHIESDVVIEIPPETCLAGAPRYVEGEVPQLTDLSRLARRTVCLCPVVRKLYVELPKPSLDNNISDLQRLEQALAKSIDSQNFQMGLKVTRRLPEVLRKADWKV